VGEIASKGGEKSDVAAESDPVSAEISDVIASELLQGVWGDPATAESESLGDPAAALGPSIHSSGGVEPESESEPDPEPHGPGVRIGLPGLLCSALLALTAVQISGVPYYMTSDAAHYLADADALVGRGVRSLRHLPVFPALVEIPHSFLSPALSIQLVALVVVASLFFAGFYFLHGRFHPVAVALGAFVLAAMPLVAEGIGWFGGSMLVGYALAIVAARALGDALDQPSWRVATLAAVAGALTVATHTVPTTVLAVWAGYLVAAALIRAVRTRTGLAHVLVVTGTFGASCVASVLLNRSFYFAVEQPVKLGLDLGKASIIWSWAFRNLPVMWIGLSIAGTMFVLFDARPSARRLSVLALISTGGALLETVLLRGDPSYLTRGLYALMVPVAVGAAWLIDRAITSSSGEWSTGSGRLVIASITLLAGGVLWSYNAGLSVAVPYYNRVDSQEMEAIDWLRDHPGGTVAVGPKSGDRIQGTLYAWELEGLARHRAIGTGRPFLYLLKEAQDDSHDVERLFAGDTTLESGAVRIGLNQERDAAVVQVQVNGDWTPAFVAAVLQDGPTPRGWLEPIAVSTGASGTYEIEMRTGPGPSSVEVRPDEGVPGEMDAATSSLRVDGASGTVGVRVLRSPDDTTDRQLADRSNGAPYFRFHQTSPTWKIVVSGADDVGVTRTSYRADEIARRQGIRYVWTWNDSLEGAAMTRRECASSAFRNGEVTIWSWRPGCKATM